MFERGDFINAVPPADYGEWTCLMFTEDAQIVHGNHLKYMGKVRPVCQTYKETPENQRNLLCQFLQTSVSAEKIYGEICW